ncbi:MAG: hypothetical protein A2315_02925 [Ignavibacteria bacterium RIFOXYB2_FULL_35_12]|nr:MAG: hypothetical protein A2058_11215 [Ignavibacteria bacterium GWA2_36_19]OGU52724.1 MAG: hypothetical protein A2006_13610 [Ignavibacteria bacterium GWC2_35_8]OGU61100.1 MAG: hypothetical protein A2X60_16990 [Ignavibacteria bacterium GWF2_35_20]OGU80849.1 MAG: hypothetical protein A2254_06395 [Ignavibacteria bacterium RIFOXYA2_FULL_35_9]OGU84881.1 MAG: hypothetical protein A3K31_16810 [Ignavibacteria bacterium RIFOXYA12_FULL_35_25]OGU92740.1 MAG: hypothetical protein A2492_11660 [Ignavibac
MKILHLYPDINLTCGISKSIYSIVTNTNEIYQNYVFCLGGDGIDKYRKAKINILVFPVNKRGLFQSFKIFFKLFYLVSKQNIDIIHSHHRYFDFLAFIISKFTSVITITSVRSKVYGRKLFSYKAQILIACSNAIKEHLIEYFKIDQRKIKVIYNFVDPKRVMINTKKSDLKKELGIDDRTTVIGFIGRFSIREKGIDILLESFKDLNKENAYSFVLLLIGDGEDKTYMNNFISTNNLKVLVLSPKENIFDYYNIIDIVVLPSRVEPFGNVAIEAGLMKKAFIGSDIDGLREIIDNSINGILVDKENIGSLTEKLRILIEESELRIRLGEELYHKVANNFTSEKIIPLFKQTYQQLMNENR